LASSIRLPFPSALGSPVAMFDVLPDMTFSGGRVRPVDGSTSARLNTTDVWPTGACEDGLSGRMYGISRVRDARPTAAMEDGMASPAYGLPKTCDAWTLAAWEDGISRVREARSTVVRKEGLSSAAYELPKTCDA
jgi:hypothetical protein